MVRRPVSVLVAVTALASLMLAGCSTSATPATTTRPDSVTASTASCHWPHPSRPVVATPVAGVASDWNVTSFDGTVIRAHWFPVHPASTARYPTVFMGPGWSLSGDTDTSGSGVLGQIPISDLWAAGYNVLTWDPRGFGKSGGESEVDSPAYEARDVSTLIDWVATRPGVELDAPGNPRMGMVGGSYGGGIQLVTAATDCRVDAIVPIIAWHSLVTSLDKAGTPKTGWSGILTNLSASDHVDPEVTKAEASGRDGSVTPAEEAWFAARGPGALVARIHIPTLIIQGTVDTLFTLQEGVDNYEILHSHGVPTAMVWFCGGHGVCLTPPGNQALPVTATIAWLNRYVKRDTSVATGPRFQFVDQNATSYSADGFPVPTGAPFTAAGHGTLSLVASGGAGPTTIPAGSTQELAGLVGPITPSEAANAVTIGIPFGNRSGVVVGAPRLTLKYSGTTPPGTRPTRVFAQLVDGSTGLVLGNQITPIDVTLDGRSHTTTVPLEMVAYTAKPGAHVELQLVATTVAYATPRLGGHVDFTAVHIALPVAADIPAR